MPACSLGSNQTCRFIAQEACSHMHKSLAQFSLLTSLSPRSIAWQLGVQEWLMSAAAGHTPR
jgi:hypothetical protein